MKVESNKWAILAFHSQLLSTFFHWYFNIFTRDGNFTDVDFLYTYNLHVLCDFYQAKMVTVVAQNLLKT